MQSRSTPKHLLPLVLILATSLLAGCARETFYQNMYHGMQKSDELLDPAADPAPVEEKPRYDQYKKERDEITGRAEPDSRAP